MKIYCYHFPDGAVTYGGSASLILKSGHYEPQSIFSVIVDDALGNAFLFDPTQYIVDEERGQIRKK